MSNSTYFVDGYPYSDTHNLNLDWVINKLKEIEIQMGEITDGLEVHVKDDTGTEVYVFTVKSNGVYITRPDGGTPIYYNLATGQLHAPTFDGQSILTATARTTGQLRAGSLVLDTPLPITGGGTGATTATEARTALGAMASDAVIPITQGGTGATTAPDARTALGAMASDAVIPVTQGGTGATTAAEARTALGAVAKAGDTMTGDLIISKSTPFLNLHNGDNHGGIYESSNGMLILRQFSPDQTKYCDYRLPAVSNAAVSGTLDIITSAQFRSYSATAGSDGVLGAAVHDSGMYMILVRDTNNYAHYWWGIVNKADSAVPAVTMLANDTITYTNGNTFGSLYMSGASAYTWTSYKLV